MGAPSSDRVTKRPRLSSTSSPLNHTHRDAPANGKNAKSGKSAAEEDAFMAELLAGIDASAFDMPPSSAPPSQREQGPRISAASSAKPSPKPTPKAERTPAKAHRSPLKIVLSPTKTVPRSRPTPYARPPAKEKDTPEEADFMSELLGLKNGGKVKAQGDSLSAVLSKPKPRANFEPQPLPSLPFQPAQRKPVASTDPGDEDFDGDWDLDALAGMDETMLADQVRYPISNPAVPLPPAGYAPTPWVRCKIESVHSGILDEFPEDEYDEGLGWGKSLVVVTPSGRRLVHLKERWADLRLRPGDIVNIVSPCLEGTRPIAITFKDTSSYLIAHPDVLVTMTSIANAMPCVRRPLLSQLVRLPETLSKPIIYGNILHGLLQESLTEKTFDAESTRRRVVTDLTKDERRLEVWGAGLDPGALEEDLGKKAEDAFVSFGRRWIGAAPKSDGNVVTAREESVGTVAINGLHDVEEDIWSPKWGLKGKVDASVQAVLERDGQTLEVVAPMEIKTGRAIAGVRHRAQTLLYTLLMEDRYGLPVPAGLLYYSQRDAIVLVEAKANEVRALVQTRNELAEWMVRERRADNADEPFLPRTVDEQRECRQCYSKDACMLYRKANGEAPAFDDDPIGDIYEAKTGHLTDEHAAFFKHWERLLTLEEQDTVRLRAQLWTMTAEERERKGRCFADMVIASEECEKGQALSKINRWVYKFERANPGHGSLLSGHIAQNDPVCLSLEPDLLYLARGFVTSLTASSVTITVQNKIDVDVMLKRVRSTAAPIFRIDKDELSSGMTRMRGNLAHLFVKDGDSQRRSLIVDLRTPKFSSRRAPKPREIPDHLNSDQRAAMDKVLTAKDYALILGMPGTGKTTTVAEIIKAIVARGQTVLLTSYTHSAVDTIVSKIKDESFGVLRIGNLEKVHPDVRHLTLEAQGKAKDLDEFENRLMTPPVVAATCLSIEYPIFSRRKFDYCIVDEASQITLPTCIGPLRNADTFVLVGDHFQLPPIVKRAEARQGGLDVSLFRRLSDAHPEAVAPLAAQYRMNEDIMALSNRLIYENRLRCGSESVAKQALVLPHWKSCAEIGESSCDYNCWVQALLDYDVKAVMVDTDGLPAPETRAGDLVQNPTEAALIYTLTRALVASGTLPSDIAVITPYRQQIKLIMRALNTSPELGGVEVLTADKAQGRDKAVVLVSLVRSNDGGHVGELLRDWRRINVSFTRAKKKLVVFGSASTLSADRLMKDFVGLMEERGWMRRLNKGDDGLHGRIDVEGPVEGGKKKEKGNKEGGGKDGEESEGRVGDEKTDYHEVEMREVKREEGEPETEKRRRKAVVGERLLKTRPFVKELVAGEFED